MPEPKTKKCSVCDKRKRTNQFWKSPSRNYRYPYCKSCQSEMQRRSKLKSRYGISEEMRATMAARCGGLCWVCQKRDAACVDHCHETGALRGLLCSQCNSGIGLLGDNETALVRAAYYLMRGPFQWRDNDNTTTA